MRKTFTIAALTIFGATTAFASDAPYDRNEAFSPEMTAKIKSVYDDDLAAPQPFFVRFAGDTETWAEKDIALIKAAFAAGS